MPYMLVRHKAKDYAKWKSVFDEHGTTRKTNGSKGGRLLRNAEDASELIILFEWDDLKRARQFAQSEDLRKTMERAGISDKPDVYFLEEVEKLSA
jgi:heme-degrading monooxygenase HmoA